MKRSKGVFIFIVMLCGVIGNEAQAQSLVYGSTRAQVEPHIAVNPTDPNNLIAVTITQLSGTSNQIAVSNAEEA